MRLKHLLISSCIACFAISSTYADESWNAAPAALPILRTAKPAAPTWAQNCHWLMDIASDGRSVELEDGSHWDVYSGDSYVLRGWRREDSIIITSNDSWFSSYDYYLTNKTNNTSIRVNLQIGPLCFGEYSHWITDVDYFGGHIQMENHMTWCVDPQDTQTINNWAVNDHVIIGLYHSYFSMSDHILINVNTDDYVRVKQY